MCGIAGVWHFSGAPEGALRETSMAMADAIAHRGPDGDGLWVDTEAGLALAHRRLAIVDLSPSGVQPMMSHDESVVISYNGELYNTLEMASELPDARRGTSDTEVLLEAIARFGIESALKRTNGIFAFAAYDRRARRLHLARDRIGVKPLYWTLQNGILAFGSELKALRSVPGLSFDIDPDAVRAYLQYGCVPAPLTIYRNIHKLDAGHRLDVSPHGISEHVYWNLDAVVRDGQSRPDRRDENEIDDSLDALLFDSVRRQMVSDVPLGAFLSGGIDSSLVVAMMQRASTRPVKTYSIGFLEQSFNEAHHAGAVAKHLGTDHTEVIVTPEDAQAVIPDLPIIYDEPFADSSQIPTFLVSRLARTGVTVALSGDGGDELFAGYVRHQAIQRLWGTIRYMPPFARRMVSGAIDMLSPDRWDAVSSVLPSRYRPVHFGDKIIKGAALLGARDPVDMYRRLVSQWPASCSDNIGWLRDLQDADGLDAVTRTRVLDTKGYLPDDILAKVDRASMAVALEVRVPILDHRMVEFSMSLPPERLVANGVGKRPLRSVLSRYVPQHLVERSKMGFGIPLGDWLKGPLREWADDLLSSVDIPEDVLDRKLLAARIQDHYRGRRNWSHALWTVLQFQAWHRAWHGRS